MIKNWPKVWSQGERMRSKIWNVSRLKKLCARNPDVFGIHRTPLGWRTAGGGVAQTTTHGQPPGAWKLNKRGTKQTKMHKGHKNKPPPKGACSAETSRRFVGGFVVGNLLGVLDVQILFSMDLRLIIFRFRKKKLEISQVFFTPKAQNSSFYGWKSLQSVWIGGFWCTNLLVGHGMGVEWARISFWK